MPTLRELANRQIRLRDQMAQNFQVGRIER
jgi:hypothetical protein